MTDIFVRPQCITHCGLVMPHRFGSTYAQVMACCLTAPRHYLNQYWLIIKRVLWHSFELNFIGSAHHIDIKTFFPRYGDSHVKDKWDHLIFNMGTPILVSQHLYIETAPTPLRGQWVNRCPTTMKNKCILYFMNRNIWFCGCLFQYEQCQLQSFIILMKIE